MQAHVRSPASFKKFGAEKSASRKMLSGAKNALLICCSIEPPMLSVISSFNLNQYNYLVMLGSVKVLKKLSARLLQNALKECVQCFESIKSMSIGVC
jgi:hypothetical protein